MTNGIKRKFYMGFLITIAGVNTFKLKREGVWCLAYIAVCACVRARVCVCVCVCV